jgi:TonB family protein
MTGVVLLGWALKVTVVFAAAWVAAGALRGAAASARHAVWAAAILCGLLLPALQLAVPSWAVAGPADLPGLWNIEGAIGATGTSMPSLPASSINAVAPSGSLPLTRVVLWVWIAGMGLLLLRLVWGVVSLLWTAARCQPVFDERVLRAVIDCAREAGETRAIRVLAARSATAMPMTWGLFSPRILLPSSCSIWPEDQLRLVLAHELAHVRRFDWALQVLSEFARALYWFHPLAWTAARKLREESERACDDAVIRAGQDSSHYASVLLELARTSTPHALSWSAGLAMARPTNLERRFTAMLDPHMNRSCLSARRALLTSAASLLLILPLAALRLPAQEAGGALSGTIYDASSAAVPNATIVMTNEKARTKDMTVSGADGNFQFKTLPPGEYEMRVLKPGFALYVQPGIELRLGQDKTVAVNLRMGTISEKVTVKGDAGSGSSVANASPVTPPLRIRVGGAVQASNLIKKVAPIYPASAKANGVQGSVILEAVISKEGEPLSLRVMNSQIDPDLARAAVEAVNQWRYTPTLLNGEPIEVVTEVTVNFTLAP